ncbi:MAG: hypothetical protein A3I05_08770 [Deltaproteobacteria bacterium RIFCSPLOWO2_02_FULL_44_10]|nr:MAG: hypothetical protein A3C46_02300 [Deltaproteobacteria bacterium RIFCSPHIGHO2_02_FULL_44_16]OGQ45788.1 MAG: hypothetical protein A3I05_08770 [Deltaproteobacteria bacterium RIFCSPLOWO2_02_FULL_44_10]
MKGRKLAVHIKKIRSEKGFTQEKLAQLAGLSVGHVIRLESRRKTNPTMETLKKISKALGISFEVFVGSEQEQTCLKQ